MKKRKYYKPISVDFEIITENIIANSGDAGGSINPMPWGSNHKGGYNSEDWSHYDDESDIEYWK